MTIIVNERIHLSEFRPSDKCALTELLNDRDIDDRTLRIPFPYTDADADEWLALAVRCILPFAAYYCTFRDFLTIRRRG